MNNPFLRRWGSVGGYNVAVVVWVGFRPSERE
jgi:hypothetical protein